MKPVAWRSPDGSMREDEGQGEPPFDDWTPLYTRPTPMSYERIASIWRACCQRSTNTTAELVSNFVRAVELELFEGE